MGDSHSFVLVGGTRGYVYSPEDLPLFSVRHRFPRRLGEAVAHGVYEDTDKLEDSLFSATRRASV